MGLDWLTVMVPSFEVVGPLVGGGGPVPGQMVSGSEVG